jgi:predicted metal-binding protein
MSRVLSKKKIALEFQAHFVPGNECRSFSQCNAEACKKPQFALSALQRVPPHNHHLMLFDSVIIAFPW